MTSTHQLVLPTEGLKGCLIDGEWRNPVGRATNRVMNPSTREQIVLLGEASSQDVDLAVQSARTAFQDWKARPARERGRLLISLGDLVEEHQEELARLLAAETGNAIRTQSRGEIIGGAEVLRYCGSIASEIKGETLPFGEDLISYTEREPIGVVGAIIPWNSPFILAAVKLGMALVTGNTFVLKPAEDAPLAVIRLAELSSQLLPAGVFNVVAGTGANVGQHLANHPDVDKVTFTGSSAVGHGIMRSAADRLAHVTLELGGKSPCIVFPDSDSDETAQLVVDAMRFARQGQSCTAGSRLYVHEEIWESFIPKLEAAMRKLKVGDALDENSDMGAVINERRLTEINAYVQEAADNGAEIRVGGTVDIRDDAPLQAQPTLLTGVDHSWRIVNEEVFGPVLVAIPWKTEAQVIEYANDTHYGLAAYVFTSDIDAALRMTRQINAGWIQVNRAGGQIPGMSYGGVKSSGFGREYSLEGALDAYTTRKSVTIAIAP